MGHNIFEPGVLGGGGNGVVMGAMHQPQDHGGGKSQEFVAIKAVITTEMDNTKGDRACPMDLVGEASMVGEFNQAASIGHVVDVTFVRCIGQLVE